jgi:aconitate hydratase
MIKLIDSPVVYRGGALVKDDGTGRREGTISARILAAHNSGDDKNLRLKFDALCSHDITYVGIIQTARMSGLREFPVPYVLTNCHNSLCAVGGTINEDDHIFGLSAAKKYGGIFVPAHEAVIHAYMRERMAGCGKMILGSDSHTRYGALGTMAIGEGGPELVKQLLGLTYDIARPDVVAVRLTGAPKKGVGPQDVAIALIGAVFSKGFVKNKALEFIGDGVGALSADFRSGIDVMTTETTCLTSIWRTDETIREYYKQRGREDDFTLLEPEEGALYDCAIELDLSEIEPMIALPFHPSNAYTLREFRDNAPDLLREVEKYAAERIGARLDLTSKCRNGAVTVDQAVIAGCAGGTFENLAAAADILRGRSTGTSLQLSVYPMSAPVFSGLLDCGAVRVLSNAGAVIRTAFCGPCFGAGDVPGNGGLSIRHSTRNFENREGSRPSDGQIACVALMDARSIAATAANGGVLTAADEIEWDDTAPEFVYDDAPYRARVYEGFGKADPDAPLVFGPNITDWPAIPKMRENLLLRVVSVITDPVTTTDELIPSGESSSYRSNPIKLSRLTLSRKDPAYVGRADAVAAEAAAFERGDDTAFADALRVFEKSGAAVTRDDTLVASVVVARRPGDGSAREQAASCQRVLGGGANIAREYATKRYRSNLINWGMLPLLSDESFAVGDVVLLPDVRSAVLGGAVALRGIVYGADKTVREASFSLGELTDEERAILAAGCLANRMKEKSEENNK